MPTEITEYRDERLNSTTLKVKGELMLHDAELIRSLVVRLLETPDASAVVDLADLAFLDSEGAHILSNLAGLNRVRLVGLEIFLQTAVNDVERRSD